MTASSIDGDLDKIAGLAGAWFHINAFQIHGVGLSTHNIFNYTTVSSIEARPSTRLFEAWLEQKLLANMASIRFGQLTADSEFFVSNFGTLYIKTNCPNIAAADLPSGGPQYPLATPGIRLKLCPNDQIAVLAALFNGDLSGAGFTGLQEIKDPAVSRIRRS
jgi:porin